MTYGGATGQRQLAHRERERSQSHAKSWKSCWKFRAWTKIPFDVICFCLRKQPGGSAPNRDFSLSVPKIDFLGVLYFFWLKNEVSK